MFPQGAAVSTERAVRSGTWRDVNALSGSPARVSDSYQVLALPHGGQPQAAHYAYLLLPDASVDETRAAASDPGLRIEANDDQVAAVSLPRQGVYAANLWQAGDAPRGGATYVSSSAPAAVVVMAAGDRLQLAVADPTQRAAALEICVGQAVDGVLRLAPGITVLQRAPQLRLRIDTAGAAGASFVAEFTRNGGEGR